jgi:hypothetical protein
MNNLGNIKEKVSILIKEFESKQLNTPDEIMNRFKELFKDEYFEINKNEKKPYFESHSENMYIKNGYGIGISKVWGPMDFAGGGAVSHKGVDVYIFSAISDEYVTLLEWSERNTKLEDSEKLYDIDLSINKLKKIRNDIVFKVLPDEIKNNEELIKERYRNLKISAEVNHENDINDDLISYYGGLDVTINSTEYYLYNSLLEHIDDEYFMRKAVPLFVTDFPNYICEQIDICKHALYMIENQEQYYKLADLDELIFSLKADFNQLELFKNEVSEKNKNTEIQLKESVSECKKLSRKKYNIIDRIVGKRKNDRIKLNNIQIKIDILKSTLEEINRDFKDSEFEYTELEKQENLYKQEQKELYSKLERKFKDFTLNPDFDDEPYINGEYYLKVSLNRLTNKENEYREKLNILQKVNSYVTKEIKVEKEHDISEVEIV